MAMLLMELLLATVQFVCLDSRDIVARLHGAVVSFPWVLSVRARFKLGRASNGGESAGIMMSVVGVSLRKEDVVRSVVVWLAAVLLLRLVPGLHTV